MRPRTLGASILIAWSLSGCTSKTVIGVMDGGRVPCTSTANCDSYRFCQNRVCVPKLVTGACADTGEHQASEVCLLGTCLGGACCATACASDPLCGATSCDVGSGSCIYRSEGTSCGAPESCSGEEFRPPSACDGVGSCAASPPQPCAPYLCNSTDNFCYNACTYQGQCSANAYCAGRFCQPKETPGQFCVGTSTSDANSACLSGICSENCCIKDCPADPTTNNCKGTCDDTGACIPLACPNNFGCGGAQVCKNRCASAADCAAPAFCDPVGGTGCCSRYNRGDTLYVNGTSGDDGWPCCGTVAFPCQTLTHAMELIASSKRSGVILNAGNGLPSDSSWTPNETYPVHLGWGVTLYAPSIYFANQSQASDIFQVYSYGPADIEAVTIKGGLSGLGGIGGDGVFIGWDMLLQDAMAGYHHTKIAVNAGVLGETAVPLVLSEVWLNADDTTGQAIGLNVGAGATVTLGPEPVAIGAGELLGAHSPLTTDRGISCAGAGASIRDDPGTGRRVLTMDGMTTSYLDVEDGCTVVLTQAPTFGYRATSPPGWDGTEVGCCGFPGCFGTCSTSCQRPEPAVAGVLVAGNGRLTFGSPSLPGSVACANRYAFDVEGSPSDAPRLALGGAIVDLLDYASYDQGKLSAGGIACAGAMIAAGTFSAAATTFQHSYLGVFVGPNATRADLSGDGGGGNTFGCTGALWGSSSACGTHLPEVPPSRGAALINATPGLGINARQATWGLWNPSDDSTQVWSCADTTYAACTCTGPDCSSHPSPGIPPDGADAIYLSTNLSTAPLDTGNGTQAAAAQCP